MFEAFFTFAALLVSALGYIAYTHPEGYRKHVFPFVFTLCALNMLVVLWLAYRDWRDPSFFLLPIFGLAVYSANLLLLPSWGITADQRRRR